MTALGYGTWGRYDIEQRTGGNPSQNTGVDYGKRITGNSYLTTLINAVAPGKLAGVEAALADGTRVSADAAARAKADALGDPTGTISVPTITLHTEDDPLVIVANESVFAGRVAKNETGAGSLVQLLTAPPTKYTTAPYGAGHCNFTTDEMVGVITLLNNWVQHGVYAGPGAVAQVLNYSPDPTSTGPNNPTTQAAGSATTGYQPVDVAPAWPAALPAS